MLHRFPMKTLRDFIKKKKSHESTNFNKHDLRECITLNLTHHRNFSCSLYPEAALLRAVNTAGIWFTLLSCAKCFTPVKFQLLKLSCLSQEKMSVRDTHCTGFAGWSYKEKRALIYEFLKICYNLFEREGKREDKQEKTNSSFFFFFNFCYGPTCFFFLLYINTMNTVMKHVSVAWDLF